MTLGNIYGALPQWARLLSANLHAFNLVRTRYSRDTERLIAEARERELWSREEWQKWQSERLAEVLRHAALNVPYYRQYWAARRARGDRASWEYLENWPILDKATLAAMPRAFVAENAPRGLLPQYTSGTTGTPRRIWWSRATTVAWYAMFEARWRRWYGVNRNDAWANAGGQLVTPVQQSRPPFWVWNRPLRQLYLSSYHLAPRFIPYYLDALRQYRIRYLFGYTSSLYALAQEALRLGYGDVRMQVVITNAEPVFDYQRRVIAEAFQCEVRETYGMTEIVTAAGECLHGRLHMWPEVGIVEILENGSPVPAGTPGSLVATGLLNIDMPLIRYAIGDRASLEGNVPACSCGRPLPVFRSIEGREDDVLYGTDGRQIGRLDPVFKAGLPIREAQIIQDAPDRVRVLCVPLASFSRNDAEAIRARLRRRLGDLHITVESVDQLMRGPNGKIRSVICRVPPPEKESARQQSK
jgi:phenylacetate-CoA ligase